MVIIILIYLYLRFTEHKRAEALQLYYHPMTITKRMNKTNTIANAEPPIPAVIFIPPLFLVYYNLLKI